METEVDIKQKFHENRSWNFCIWKKIDQIMVHHIDSRWHHIVLSLVAMQEKLMQLGFVYYNGEIHVIEPEEKQKYV